MKFFGTDGIRGTWGQAPFDEYTLAAIAAAFADHAAARPGAAGETAGKVVIGHDGRASAGDITGALARAFSARGLAVESTGLTSTPSLAYAARAGRYRLGVMISASHNLAADNGLKLFGGDGKKIADADEEAIEELIRGHLVTPPSAGGDGKVALKNTLEGMYAQHLQHLLSDFPAPPALTMVVDCANGGTSHIAPDLLRGQHFTVIPIHYAPDGHNINDRCGALHPETCAAEVKSREADLGLSFDGDGDRLLVADMKGKILSGDHLLLAMVLAAKKRGTLKGNGAVGTTMSNFFLEEAFAAEGLELVRADVGDRNVAREMTARGMNFGGEQSGHLISSDHAPHGDGLLTALLFIAALGELDTTADQFFKAHTPYPQGLKSLRVPDKRPLEQLDGLNAEIKTLEDELHGHGRVVVRYSGTEPKIRLMVEAPRSAAVRDALHRLETAAHKDFDLPAPKS